MLQELLGEAVIMDSVSARLYRIPGGFRLTFDDTGTYDVIDGGRTLIWYEVEGAPEAHVQADVLGRVMSLALHISGSYCLHASAVAIEGGAIAFMAPKFHGKSTTAFALVRAGARLITDDTLLIRSGDPPQVEPGIQTVRLWEDSATIHEVDKERVPESEGKYLVGSLPEERVVDGPVPLHAVYLLAPVLENEGGAAVVRRPLSSIHAALTLLGHSKLGDLLGGSEAPVLLERARSLAASVPVYGLEVTRDFARLPEVIDQLLRWHGHSGLPVETRAVTG